MNVSRGNPAWLFIHNKIRYGLTALTLVWLAVLKWRVGAPVDDRCGWRHRQPLNQTTLDFRFSFFGSPAL